MSKMVTPVNINVDEPFEANLCLDKDKESLDLKDENSNGKSSPHNDEEEIDLPERYKINAIILYQETL